MVAVQQQMKFGKREPPKPLRSKRRQTSAIQLGCEGLTVTSEMKQAIAYGLTEEGEFFAVASELCFQLPNELAEYHPNVFELLRQFYLIDLR